MKMKESILVQSIIKISIAASVVFIFVAINACDINFNDPHVNNFERIVNLEGKWKFSIGDDSLWSNQKFNDENWEEVMVPSTWENEGYHGYNGHAWYRKHFNVRSKYKNYTLYVQLGWIDDVDEVYINGNLVGFTGSFPPDYKTAYNLFRSYPIPSSFMNFDGDNVISVRVYDSELGGGIVQGDVGIFTDAFPIKKEVELEGEWKFSAGDDLTWKGYDFNDQDWLKIIVPGNWNFKKSHDYDGYAWYRKNIVIPSSLKNKKSILLLGKIDDVDQAFLNGKQIGNTGDFNLLPEDYYQNGKYLELRGYYIPQDLIRYDQPNVIAVRVYDGFNIGGIYEGPVGLVTQENYTRYRNQIKRDKDIFEKLFDD
jgi:sialate O-acetylesterase